jgi:mRNA-degrading endonuclease toxin of MazEF toxin-antitoxin module
MATSRQGEVWLAELSPTVGHEQHDQRPCLVISRNEAHDSGLIVVVPGTKVYKPFLARVRVPKGVANLELDTYFLCLQVRALAEERFQRCLGTVTKST